MQLFYTNEHFVGGPSKVLHNIKVGLKEVGEEIESNPKVADPDKKVLVTQTHPCLIFTDLSKVIVGPNVCVLPIDQTWTLEEKYYKLLVPSRWVYDKYRRWISEEKLQIWPVGINSEIFSDVSDQKKEYDCLIYSKNRSSEDLEFVMKTLMEFEQTFNIVKYGSYNEEMFIDSISKSRYCFLVGNTESQGIAMEEIMSSNLPMFVWDMPYWDHRGEEYKVPATSVPYWSDICGEKTSEKEKIKDLFSEFLSKVNSYNPRQYILDNLTIEKRTKELLGFYDSVI